MSSFRHSVLRTATRPLTHIQVHTNLGAISPPLPNRPDHKPCKRAPPTQFQRSPPNHWIATKRLFFPHRKLPTPPHAQRPLNSLHHHHHTGTHLFQRRRRPLHHRHRVARTHAPLRRPDDLADIQHDGGLPERKHEAANLCDHFVSPHDVPSGLLRDELRGHAVAEEQRCVFLVAMHTGDGYHGAAFDVSASAFSFYVEASGSADTVQAPASLAGVDAVLAAERRGQVSKG